MVSLFNLFKTKHEEPKTKTMQLEQERWIKSIDLTPKSGKIINPVTYKQNKKKVNINNLSPKKNKSSNSSSNSLNNESNSSKSLNNETSKLNKKTSKQKAIERALSSISNMKDSNISWRQRKLKNDIWNKAVSKKTNDIWDLKEEVFLYTFHDKKHHKYMVSFNIDCDKKDIMYTSQIILPYRKEFMEYWIPGKTTFAIIGGTFDREILFIGRVSEINQRGEEIEVVGQNIGWKFKPYMTIEFQKSLKGMTVKNAVKMIFKQLGFDKGKYYIDLDGIPDLDKYTIGEDCDVQRGGETVQNVPQLKEVVKNLKSFDMNKYVAKESITRETQQFANHYDEATKLHQIDWARDSTQSFYPSSMRKNYGVETDYKDKEIIYEPILSKIEGEKKLKSFLIKGYSGESEHTYEEVLNNICSAIDAHFFIIDTTVCFMSFNALLAKSSSVQKKDIPTIDFWQLKDESYILDVNQYGYYNTVEIKYKNGTIEKAYDDLVRVFGKLKITYNEPDLNYDGAMLKAQAYLSAHIRDFGMEVKATILHSGKITPANFIKIRNPQTMSESLFFIQGTAIQWSADNQTLISDLDLRYGPENPDAPEIPEYGLEYKKKQVQKKQTKGNVSAKVEAAVMKITAGAITLDEKAERIVQWFIDHLKYSFYWDSHHSVASTLQKTPSNCYDTCIAAYQMFTSAGVKCKFIHCTLLVSGKSYGHYCLEVFYKNKWVLCDLGRGGKVPLGRKTTGKIINKSVQLKNY